MLPTLRIQIERWKYNKDYDLYVSTLGRIKNKQKELVHPRINSKGYFITFSYKLNRWICNHRLVMLTWKPLKNNEEYTIDHLDSNKRNCSLKNLEWVLPEENVARGEANQLSAGDDDQYILVNSQRALLDDVVMKILAERPKLNYAEVANYLKTIKSEQWAYGLKVTPIKGDN